jgi:hypothetical protein
MKSTVLLGKNYVSLLISFALFERNKKVYLIDEHQKFPEEAKYLRGFERVMLKTWGLDCQIPSLLDLEGYLAPSPYRIVFDGRHLNLGNSPSQNFNEILRKNPEFFSSEPLKNENSRKKFDKKFNNFSDQFGIKFFRFIDHKNFNMESVWPLMPQELRDIFADFKINTKKPELRFLLCFFRGVFQNQFSADSSDFSLLFILLFLLSPRFELNRKKFEDDLLKHFSRKGGEIIPGKEMAFQTKGSNIEKLTSPSEESKTIEKLYITCGEFGEVSMIPNHSKCYTSIKIHLNLKISDLFKQEFLVSNTHRIGGDYPLTKIKFEKEGIFGEVLIPYLAGSKVSFDEEKTLEILLNDIQSISGNFPHRDFRPIFSNSYNFWSGSELVPQTIWPYFNRPMKNLNIFHPSNSCMMDGLSLLSQIKDERGHIL